MKRIRLLCTIGLVCAIGLALQCTQPNSQLAGMGGSEVVGKVVTTANKPVSNASIILFNSADSSKKPLDTVVSGPDGAYKLDSLPLGIYNLVAQAKNETGDSIFGFHGNIQNTIIAPKGEQPHIVNVGTDTLYKPGKISGRVILSPGDSTTIDCYIPGTSYIAKSNDTGVFTISSIPPGTYSVYYVDSKGKYQKGKDPIVQVKADQITMLPDKVLMLSAIGNPPAPSGMTLHYDTATGQVTVAWIGVNVTDLHQYDIVRRIDADSFKTIGTVLRPLTSFIDTVYKNASDTGNHVCTYELFSEDSTNHKSDPPSVDTIAVASPFKVGTFLLINAVPSTNTSVDSTAINDSVKIAAEFSNKYFQVRSLYWSIGTPDSVVDSSLFASISGKDTLKTIFRQVGIKPVYVKAVDEKGKTKIASLTMQVVRDAPSIQYVSPSVTINFQTSFQCSVSVTHRFGLCSLMVDFNHDGKFEFKRKGAGLDTIVNTNTATAWGKVAIRISDSHGNFIDTGFVVTINPPALPHWETSSSLNYPRKWLSTCVMNNKIYAIGGLRKYVRPGSTTNLSKAAGFVETLDSVWIPADTLKIGRYGFSTGVYNNNAYVFGGIGIHGATKSIEQFDPTHPSWTLLADTMPFYRTGAASCVIGAKLYLFGGRIPASTDTVADSVCNAIYTFDFTTKQWHELPNRMSTRRSDFQAACIRNKIYLIGGWDDGGNVLSSVEIFDTVSQQCVAGISLPEPRYDFAAVSYKDSLYIVGGSMNSDGGSYYNDIYRFSPSTNWQQITTFPNPEPIGMYGMSASVVNGAIVIVGGSSSSSTNDPGFASSLVRKYYP